MKTAVNYRGANAPFLLSADVVHLVSDLSQDRIVFERFQSACDMR